MVAGTAPIDVVVVGAGPAGATAALLLARAGRRVTLIDRDVFPRDKACGDLLGTSTIALLRKLQIDLDVVTAAPPLTGAYVYAPTGRRIGATVDAEAAQRLGARVIPRRIFDAALVAAAQRAGAKLRCAKVTGVLQSAAGAIAGVQFAHGPPLPAPLTIGADGWSSIVARALLATPRAVADAGIAVRAYIRDVDAGTAMRFFIGAPRDGYGWIFPLAGGGANVGLGFVRGEPGSQDVHAAFSRFLRRPELRDAGPHEERRAWPIPFGWRGTPVSAAGALLAGDAASLASALSGSGIHTAIASGALAAETANHALDRADVSATALRVYDQRLRPIARRLRFERWLHEVAGTARGSASAIRVASAIPGAGRLTVSWLLSLG